MWLGLIPTLTTNGPKRCIVYATILTLDWRDCAVMACTVHPRSIIGRKATNLVVQGTQVTRHIYLQFLIFSYDSRHLADYRLPTTVLYYYHTVLLILLYLLSRSSDDKRQETLLLLLSY